MMNAPRNSTTAPPRTTSATPTKPTSSGPAPQTDAARAPRAHARPTLYGTLRRIHLSVALIAVCTAGISLTALGLTALRAYADHNLRLVARSIAYTVEAPVVFRDASATRETLSLIAASEDVAVAKVFDRDRQPLAVWQRSDSHRFPALQRLASDLLTSGPVEQPVYHESQQVGSVEVAGDPVALLHFLGQGTLGLLACLLLTAIGAHYMSSRMIVHIIDPVRNLMRVAHAVRSQRAFGERMPPARIAELNALGEDFNGLLDELEAWQNQLQHENRSLAHRATHDGLTGLLNRAAFEEALELAVRSAAARNQHTAVLYLDSDDFKNINDRHGHAAGDAVLIGIAQRIRGCMRESDLVARLGGDEFAVLATGLRQPEDAAQIAEHILEAMQSPLMLPSGGSIVAPMSIGLAIYPVHARSAKGLLHAADVAMYGAKRHSGATWRSAEPTPPDTLV
ncbi:diguanylate cyclase domain-containing protein [Cupriavidus plantarum]|uniref:diguanylate cyclase domain-containing protein n=1 Tax=Cupriavidus plantarum TaxID=942865 RepID=UPI001B15E455|nr:diguanylate cyclase [Cupriavidus plantarum]CAG2151277.1 Diguanylate cyclase DgcN [Cupriavidus plantarum]SMR65911.1 signal transduction protein [Cupriavidus plantarum]